MKYIQYPARIDCEHDKCGEWHHGGHDLDELLPEDTLETDKGKRLCIACGGSIYRSGHDDCKGKMAVRVATRFGMIDGSHHKQWVIDQMVLAILGTDEYLKWVGRMSIDPDYEPWNRGIAP